MASEDRLREKVGRKLTKRKGGAGRAVSMDIPERFKDGEDADEDFAATGENQPVTYGQQSIFKMVAAAGSKTDMSSSPYDESEEESDEEKPATTQPISSTSDSHRESTSGNERPPGKKEHKSSKSRLFQSLPKLRLKKEKAEAQHEDRMSSSQILPPRPSNSEQRRQSSTPEPPSRDAPVLSRMIKARAEMEQLDTTGSAEKEVAVEGTTPIRSPTTLPQALMDIFGFEEPERVITEYPCWLLQSVLLQGYMYITEKHVCFYAYLPKKESVTSKSGYLGKRGRNNPRFNRYWFQLRGDVLTYYLDQSQPYFPSGHVDLRYGISATHDTEKGKETHFAVATDKRTYHFKADSTSSAKEWVKNLQKVIFRSHNDGDSVKISLPIANILDIERNPVLDFADTVKIRVIDNDETYAIDEVS